MKSSTVSAYRVGILSDINGINRLALFGPQRSIWNSYVLDHCYLSLYRNSDLRFDWIPHLAQDFPSEIQGEESFWVSTARIKERVCWCDGLELTAEDLQFSYAAILALDPVKLGGAWSSFVDPLILDHVEALDRYTIKFYLKQKPGLGRWQCGMLQAPILSKRYWAPKLQRALASSDPIEVMYAVEDAANEPRAGAFVGGIFDSIPLIEGYRADHLRFPYTQVLDGLHGKLGMPSLVQPH